MSGTHNYVTIEPAAANATLAHEFGHACLLPHDESPGNLMNATVVATAFPVLSNLQIALVRGSRHVTYF